MTNMEMADSSHKFGPDWLQTVKTHEKSVFQQWVENRDVSVLCVICCAGPLPFSVVFIFFPLTLLPLYCLCLLEDIQATWNSHACLCLASSANCSRAKRGPGAPLGFTGAWCTELPAVLTIPGASRPFFLCAGKVTAVSQHWGHDVGSGQFVSTGSPGWLSWCKGRSDEVLPFVWQAHEAEGGRQEETQQGMKLQCHQFRKSEEITCKEMYKQPMELPYITTASNGLSHWLTHQRPGKVLLLGTQI